MTKREKTKEKVLTQALWLTSQGGLDSLSLGALSERTGLSRSGLFALFGSKLALQKKVLDAAGFAFAEAVVKPAMREDRPLARLRSLFQHWLGWVEAPNLPGGCIFVAAMAELDDQPGPLRDHLLKIQSAWERTRLRLVREALAEAGVEESPRQVSQEIYGIMLGYHYSARLLQDPKAKSRALRAFRRIFAEPSPIKSKRNFSHSSEERPHA